MGLSPSPPRSSRIRRVPLRDINHHPLTRPREQHAVGILQVTLVFGFLDVVPAVATNVAGTLRVPSANANGVELQSPASAAQPRHAGSAIAPNMNPNGVQLPPPARANQEHRINPRPIRAWSRIQRFARRKSRDRAMG
jgi:hypothetical protein